MKTQTLDGLLESAVRRLPLPCDDPAEPTAVRLRDGGIWSTCSARAGVRLRCVSGTLWVTHPRSPGDVILHPGESFVARAGSGKVVVQALEDAAFWIE